MSGSQHSRDCLEWPPRLLGSPSRFLYVSPTATHSQIMLLHSLKKANYQLPLLITDSGEPPLSNSTEVKVQVCVCKKNKMHCSSASSLRGSLLPLLATFLLTLLLSKCLLTDKHGPRDHAMFCLLRPLKNAIYFFRMCLTKLLVKLECSSEYPLQTIGTCMREMLRKRIRPTTTLAKWMEVVFWHLCGAPQIGHASNSLRWLQ